MGSDNSVEDYGWQSSEQPHSCDYIAPEILAYVQKLNSQRVVDIGSGNGAICAFLKQHNFYVAGIEHDTQGVAIAKEHNPDIAFYNLGVQDDPQTIIDKEGLFDCVISTEVIEHLFAPHLLPQFATRLLRDNGYLLITTPYHGYLKNLALSLLNKWDQHHTALWHGGHIKFWSRSTLTQLLQDNGFDVIEFSGVGRLPFLWKSMVILARKAG